MIDWNLIFNGFTAIGTVGAILVVLFLGPLKNWWSRPLLKVTFENRPRWKVETVVLNDVPLPAIWFRLKIENIGKSIAKNIEGKLMEVWHPDGKTAREDIDPMELHWVGAETPLIDLNPGEFEYLDVFHVLKEIELNRYTDILKEKRISGSDDFWRLDRLHLYTTDRTPRNVTFDPERDDYFLKVTVYSANADSVRKTYKLYNSRNDQIEMKEVEEMVEKGK